MPDQEGSELSALLRADVQAKVDANRQASETRFKGILASPETAPAFRFPAASEVAIRRSLREAKRGTLFISFHTIAYFILFGLIERFDERCDIVADPSIVERFKRATFLRSVNVRCAVGLTAAQIKACISKQRHLFIMADVLQPNASHAPMPLAGKAVRYTISWAELAVRYQLNVVPLFLKDRGDVADVFWDPLGERHQDPYRLACSVFALFEEFLEDDFTIWENLPAYNAYAAQMPDVSCGYDARLAARLWQYGACDRDIAKLLARAAKTAC